MGHRHKFTAINTRSLLTATLAAKDKAENNLGASCRVVLLTHLLGHYFWIILVFERENTSITDNSNNKERTREATPSVP